MTVPAPGAEVVHEEVLSGENAAATEPDQTLTFQCPNCDQVVAAPSGTEEMVLTCPSCAAKLRVASGRVLPQATTETGDEPKWHLALPGGERRGPSSENQTIAWVLEGRIPRGSLVWCPGMSGWMSVETTPPFSRYTHAEPASRGPTEAVTAYPVTVRPLAPERNRYRTFCRACGSQIDPRAVICVVCGVPVAGHLGRYGRAASPVDTPNWGVIVGAAVVVLAFFLPWFDLVLFSLHGYELPSKASALMSFAEHMDAPVTAVARFKVHLLKSLYLLPVFGISAVTAETVRARNRRAVSVLCALGVAGVFVLFLIILLGGAQDGSGFLDVLSVGFYALVAGVVTMVVAALTNASKPA